VPRILRTAARGGTPHVGASATQLADQIRPLAVPPERASSWGSAEPLRLKSRTPRTLIAACRDGWLIGRGFATLRQLLEQRFCERVEILWFT
jgi:hypothetical protein